MNVTLVFMRVRLTSRSSSLVASAMVLGDEMVSGDGESTASSRVAGHIYRAHLEVGAELVVTSTRAGAFN